jgi:2-polyprenyl-6-methoxyphenol hydroxylase-like FAD-dependent oxidoreductase
MVKIVILGAGISGLSTYLFLRKHLHLDRVSKDVIDIEIYEAYDIHQPAFNASNEAVDEAIATGSEATSSATDNEPVFTPQAIGSGIGISRNGLSVLARLDEHEETAAVGFDQPKPGIIEQLALYGHPIRLWEMSTARGFALLDVNLLNPAPSSTEHTPKLASAGTTSKANLSEKRNDVSQYGCIMIARQACWEILRDRVLALSPQVIVRRKVVDVFIGDDDTPNTIVFEDGKSEKADLVIGADGLRSMLRKAMFQDKEEGDGRPARTSDLARTPKQSTNGNAATSWSGRFASWLPSSRPAKLTSPKKDLISPNYEGLVGVGGFVPSSVIQATGHKPGNMGIVFGSNGFFGYGYLTSAGISRRPTDLVASTADDTATIATGPSASNNRSASQDPDMPILTPGPLAGWWSTFSSTTPFPYASAEPKLATSSTQNGTTRMIFNKQLALSALQARHTSWKNPSIRAILDFVATDTQLHGAQGKGLDAVYPTWTTPELPHWQLRGRAVLVGDAAHALQPSSGQGACQALEDAETLALCLKRFLGAENQGGIAVPSTGATSSATLHAALTRALASFQEIRMPRLHKIYVQSQKMSRMKADMNVVEEYLMYLFIWMISWRIVVWLTSGGLQKYNNELMGYDLPSEVEAHFAKESDGAEGRAQA